MTHSSTSPDMPPAMDEMMVVADIKKPYGIKGWLWLISHLQDTETLFAMQPWWMKTAAGLRRIEVEAWRTQGTGIVVKFVGFSDRTMAETFYGVKLYALRDSLPAKAEDEYYWSELVGLTVKNNADECFGVVHEVFDNGAHPILVVRPTSGSIDKEERLIPWHTQTIVSVSLADKLLTVDWGSDY